MSPENKTTLIAELMAMIIICLHGTADNLTPPQLKIIAEEAYMALFNAGAFE